MTEDACSYLTAGLSLSLALSLARARAVSLCPSLPLSLSSPFSLAVLMTHKRDTNAGVITSVTLAPDMDNDEQWNQCYAGMSVSVGLFCAKCKSLLQSLLQTFLVCLYP